jgi:phosphoribosylformylglycinamidine synthase
MTKKIFSARILVTLKPGVLDPQGKAITRALAGLGLPEITEVRQGKVFDLRIESLDAEAASARLSRGAEALLANSVIEDYHIEILP